ILNSANPIRIKNDSGDTNTFVLTATNNDESEAYFGAGKDQTLVGKKIRFNNVATGATIQDTVKNNIKYTDSESTKLLKKDNYELYYEDFKDTLPSTYFTSVSGTLTVSDDLIDPLIQLTTCKVLQSG